MIKKKELNKRTQSIQNTTTLVPASTGIFSAFLNFLKPEVSQNTEKAFQEKNIVLYARYSKFATFSQFKFSSVFVSLP